MDIPILGIQLRVLAHCVTEEQQDFFKHAIINTVPGFMPPAD